MPSAFVAPFARDSGDLPHNAVKMSQEISVSDVTALATSPAVAVSLQSGINRVLAETRLLADSFHKDWPVARTREQADARPLTAQPPAVRPRPPLFQLRGRGFLEIAE